MKPLQDKDVPMRPLPEILTAVQNQQPATPAELRHAVLALAAMLQSLRGAIWVTPRRKTKAKDSGSRRNNPVSLAAR